MTTKPKKTEVKNEVSRNGDSFIKNEIDLNEVKEMKYYPQKNRLELIFTDDSFFVVSTLNSWAYEFIDLIKEQAPKITYSEDSLS